MEHHIFFAFVSLVNPSYLKDAVHYADLAGKPYDAIQTNESAIVFKERELRKNHSAIERIFLLVSHDAGEQMAPPNKYGANITHVDFLKHRLNDECPELKDRIDTIEYPDDANALEQNMLHIASIAEKVRTYMEETSSHSAANTYYVHADMTGGYRHASVMMISILQMLSYYGVRQGDVLYSDPGDRTAQHPAHVYRATPILQVPKLLSGMDEFIHYGSVASLKDYFDYRASENSKELTALLAAMRTFSDAIRICATHQIVDTVKMLRQRLQDFHERKEKCIEEQLFDKCTDILSENYGPLLEENVSRLDIIDWCGDNKFWQQQLMLSTEWLPEYLADHKFCYSDDDDTKTFCANEGTSMSRSWAQDFIIAFNANPQTVYKSLQKTLRARKEQFWKDFQHRVEERQPLKPLLDEAVCQDWRTMADFLNEYADAEPSFRACKAKQQSWESFQSRYPAFLHVMKLIYKDRQKNPSYKKTFEECLQTQSYPKILSAVQRLPEGIQKNDLLKSKRDTQPAPVPRHIPLPKGFDAARLKTDDTRWNNRLDEYVKQYQNGTLKTELSLPDCLRLLHRYFQLRVTHNKINHANAEEALNIKCISDDIHDYLDQLRAFAEALDAAEHAAGI